MPVVTQVRLVITHADSGSKAAGNFCNPTDSIVGLTACRQHARHLVLALMRGNLPSFPYVLHADPLERTVRGTAPAGHSNALTNRALLTKD